MLAIASGLTHRAAFIAGKPDRRPLAPAETWRTKKGLQLQALSVEKSAVSY
ncbi:hypothetical protein [Pseudomonas chlororaphis]|uniref:hypothetical protein n=1 Tax=Pseudomonas chlororaphis TaxID=587753 RepID=UPI00236546A3|nr:hypothetical protein [Pseudomonas chlororaphis]WDG55226.1 hypothetical protein PUP76_05470 [Pseudomonas chlororaphis]WDH89572.1 hypothetical protein PUP74_06015 [Pseudomonas chlororaphis]